MSARAVANLNPKLPGAGKKLLRIREPASRTRGFMRPGKYPGISFIKLRVELHSDRLQPRDDAGTLLHHAFDEFGIPDPAPAFKRIAEELLGRVRSPHALLTFRVEGIEHPGTHEHVAARQRHFFDEKHLPRARFPCCNRSGKARGARTYRDHIPGTFCGNGGRPENLRAKAGEREEAQALKRGSAAEISHLTGLRQKGARPPPGL